MPSAMPPREESAPESAKEPESVKRVRAALEAATGRADIRHTESSTRTAEEAAVVCGVSVGQIVKSLVFLGAESGKAWLILVSGDNRVNEKALGRRLGETLKRADAGGVREATGFAIGGVAPVGSRQPISVVMDADLFRFGELWAAAGSPRDVFRTDPQTLARLTDGRIEPVT